MVDDTGRQIVRLSNVVGRDNLVNDIFFSSIGGDPKLNIIFFGGDIQNELEVMSSHRDNRRYAEKWSYESVANSLLTRVGGVVPGAHLWIVRASRWLVQTFACYDHFLRCNETGVPDFSGVHSFGGSCLSAWRHLNALLTNAVTRIEGARCDLPCAIIGFSKGASVITQLLYELGVYVDLPAFREIPLVMRTRSLTWLDAGHNGQSHLWPTWEVALSRLSHHIAPLPQLYAFATPYELCDDNRPWNRRDFKTFVRLLKLHGLPHIVETFFQGEKWDFSANSTDVRADLESHFEILTTFPLGLCLSPCVTTDK